MTALRPPNGGRLIFNPTSTRELDYERVQVACGHCTACYLQRAAEWATRITHEQQLHDRSCFLTLTYNDEANPITLQERDWTLFAKRLREKMGPFQHYMVGEYGELYGRPHYHACIMGIDFDDKFPWKKSQSGCQTYTSDTLDKLWPWGHANIGQLTFESAAYCARYMIQKPQDAEARASRYTATTIDFKEIELLPEFARMSRRPALGKRWIEVYTSDVYPNDYVVRKDGTRTKTPRYYDKWYEEKNLNGYEKIKETRKAKALEREQRDPTTKARMKDKETVLLAQLNTKKRTH